MIFVLGITVMALVLWPEIENWLEPFICMAIFSMWIFYAISVDDILLNNKILKYMAKISLEIYLCHMFVYRVLEKLHVIYILGHGYLGYFFMVGLTFIGSVIVSLCIRKMIEYIEHVVKQIIS